VTQKRLGLEKNKFARSKPRRRVAGVSIKVYARLACKQDDDGREGQGVEQAGEDCEDVQEGDHHVILRRPGWSVCHKKKFPSQRHRIFSISSRSRSRRSGSASGPRQGSSLSAHCDPSSDFPRDPGSVLALLPVTMCIQCYYAGSSSTIYLKR